jgi:hypothetical protein
MLSMFAVLALHGAAFADEPKKDDAPSVVASGVIFGRYTLNLTEGAKNYNEFAIDRVYVGADATINDHFGANVTLDANRFKPVTLSTGESVTADTRYRLFVKKAYLEYKFSGQNLKARAGIVDAPLGPYMDAFWGHRYVADNFAAWAIKLPTADVGVGAYGKYRKGLLDYSAVLVNGEGYDKSEVDSGKMFQGRLSIDPLATEDAKMHLPITGYVGYALNPDDASQLIVSGAIGFEMPNLLVSGQALFNQQNDTNGFGWSAILMPRAPKIVTGVLRYDSYDPNTSAAYDPAIPSSAATTQLIAGLSHNFYKKVSGAVTFERTTTEATPDTPGQALVAHMQAGW